MKVKCGKKVLSFILAATLMMGTVNVPAYATELSDAQTVATETNDIETKDIEIVDSEITEDVLEEIDESSDDVMKESSEDEAVSATEHESEQADDTIGDEDIADDEADLEVNDAISEITINSIDLTGAGMSAENPYVQGGTNAKSFAVGINAKNIENPNSLSAKFYYNGNELPVISESVQLGTTRDYVIKAIKGDWSVLDGVKRVSKGDGFEVEVCYDGNSLLRSNMTYSCDIMDANNVSPYDHNRQVPFEYFEYNQGTGAIVAYVDEIDYEGDAEFVFSCGSEDQVKIIGTLKDGKFTARASSPVMLSTETNVKASLETDKYKFGVWDVGTFFSWDSDTSQLFSGGKFYLPSCAMSGYSSDHTGRISQYTVTNSIVLAKDLKFGSTVSYTFPFTVYAFADNRYVDKVTINSVSDLATGNIYKFPSSFTNKLKMGIPYSLDIRDAEGRKMGNPVMYLGAPVPPVSVSSLKLDKTEATLYKGETLKLNCTYLPANAEVGTDITWSSSDASIVSVDADGNIEAKKVGKTTITAKSSNGKIVKCVVTVPEVYVKQVTADGANGNRLFKNDTLELIFHITPSAEKPLTVADEFYAESSDDDVFTCELVKVDEYTYKVRITGVNNGSAYWTAYFNNYSMTGKAYVSLPVTSVDVINDTIPSVISKGCTYRITYAVNPEGAYIKNCTVTSSVDGIVSTDLKTSPRYIYITGLSDGTTKLTLNADGKTAKFDITVTDEIRCNLEGGNIDGDTSAVIIHGDYIKPLSELQGVNPVKDGSRFVGWYTEPNGKGSLVTPNTYYTYQRDIYAYWASLESFNVRPIGDYVYSGNAIKPEVVVYDGATLLTEKVDYTVAYKNNIKAADSDSINAPEVIVKGTGNYGGEHHVKFNITPLDISASDFIIDDLSAVYDEKVHKPVPVVKWGTKTLKAGQDKGDYYAVFNDASEGAYVNPGVYTIDVIGVGNFAGHKEVKITITNDVMISKANISVAKNGKSDWEYNGARIEPDIVVMDGKTQLTEGIDYEIEYVNNVKAGTAYAIIKGLGEYCGTKSVSFKIAARKISSAKFYSYFEAAGSKKNNTGIANQEYTGREVKLTGYTLTYDKDNEILTEGTDFEVKYLNNVNAGTATVIFKGIGLYSGTELKKTFKINKCPMTSEDISVVAPGSVEYCKGGAKPSAVVTYNGKVLTEGKDYKLSWSNNSAITTPATNKKPLLNVVGAGSFTGTRSVEFIITPKPLVVADGENIGLSVELPDIAIKAVKANNWANKIVVKDVDGKALADKKDYTVKYYSDSSKSNELTKNDSVNVGDKVYVVISGDGAQTGCYTGTIELIYNIIAADNNIKNAKITIKNKEFIGTGKPVTLTADDFISATITVNKVTSDLTLKDGESGDFEIIGYIGNAAKGKATVILRGIHSYSGIKTVNFNIVQKGIN